MRQANVFSAKDADSGAVHYLVANKCYRSGMYVVEIAESGNLSRVASQFIGTYADCEMFLYTQEASARQAAQRKYGYSSVSPADTQLGYKYLPVFENPCDGLDQAMHRPANMACGMDFRDWLYSAYGLRAEQEMVVVNKNGQRDNVFMRLNEIDEIFEEIDVVYGVAVFDYEPCPEVTITIVADDISQLDQHGFHAQSKQVKEDTLSFKFPASHDSEAIRHLVGILHNAVLKLDRVTGITFEKGQVTGLENYDYWQRH
ncbi:MAG: hypothetical protein OXG49_12670 [Chloroflexi bacterium]|nr:hypothetical protein [Chloroflexota bacterium]